MPLPPIRMPQESIVEVVRPLQMQLAEAKSLASKYKGSDAASSSVIDELFENIEGDVQFINDIFLWLERWEKQVKDKIGDIVKHLDDVLEDDKSSKDKFQSQLQTVNENVSGLKQHMTPALQLPLDESSTALSSQFVSSSSSMAIEGFQQLEHKAIPHDIMGNLKEKLNMDNYLKKRLQSFLIFPPNSVIKKRLLIYWWMGNFPSTNVESEEDGERNLGELIRQGFIIPHYRAHNPGIIDSCTLHPQVKRLLLYDLRPDFNFDLLPNSVSSLDLNLGIFNIDDHLLKFGRDWFMNMRSHHAMHFGRWHSSAKHHIEVDNSEFLVWLESFQNLRYLSLQGISRIMKLPPSIGKLTNLRILDLRACHNLESLPVEVRLLKNLTHLDVSECYLLDHMPKGLGSLLKLQVLKGFVIGSSRRQDSCKLSELTKLESLRKLSINLGRKSVVEAGEFRALEYLVALRSLTITWAMGLSQSGLENLQILPPNLQKLDLRCFPETKAPSWLSLGRLWNLERLYIRGGNLKLGNFLDIGRDANDIEVGVTWPVIGILRLRYLREFDLEVSELQRAFQYLGYLEIHEPSRPSSTASTAEQGRP